jgi:hypothetical protein
MGRSREGMPDLGRTQGGGQSGRSRRGAGVEPGMGRRRRAGARAHWEAGRNGENGQCVGRGRSSRGGWDLKFRQPTGVAREQIKFCKSQASSS